MNDRWFVPFPSGLREKRGGENGHQENGENRPLKPGSTVCYGRTEEIREGCKSRGENAKSQGESLRVKCREPEGKGGREGIVGGDGLAIVGASAEEGGRAGGIEGGAS